MEIEKILDELYSYSLFGIKLGLENIKKLCEALDNPQNKYKIIHLAGTNGKGSTATTIEKILLTKGYSVGKYTSPHILKFNERIQVDEKEIEDNEIVELYTFVKEKINILDIKPTFFEVTTAIMFLYFAQKKVDYVLLETGMGGRYDATNVVKADIAIITNVSMDHNEYLGNSITEIAKEKAGIIKDTPVVIVGDDNDEFLSQIKNHCTEKTKLINIVEKYKNIRYNLDYKNFKTSIQINENTFDFSLFGTHQVKNFLCAYEVAKILNIEDEIIKKACCDVKWQCRFEVFCDNPLVILDGAHNEAGIKELFETIKKQYTKDDIVVITSILKDKNIKIIIEYLEKISDNIIFTSLSENKRGVTGEYLYDKSSKKSSYYIENNMKQAYNLACEMNKKIILICGSFYTLSKFKQVILDEKN